MVKKGNDPTDAAIGACCRGKAGGWIISSRASSVITWGACLVSLVSLAMEVWANTRKLTVVGQGLTILG